MEISEQRAKEWRKCIFKSFLCSLKVINELLDFFRVESLEILSLRGEFVLIRLFLPIHIFLRDLELVSILRMAPVNSS